MAYKYKPRKSIKQRFKVTGTGKLKHQRTKRRHLLSGRSGDKMRALCRPDVLVEGHSKPLRVAMGVSGKNPVRTAHVRRMKAAQEAKAMSKDA
ncbi:MAG: bL35 family ribosomal protein [Planctomycetota bacterium]